MSPRKTKPESKLVAKNVDSVRRQLLGKALSDTAKVLPKDVEARFRVQEIFNKEYDANVLPMLKKKYTLIAEKTASLHQKTLNRRLTEAKKKMELGTIGKIPGILLGKCTFLEDFEDANICDHEVTEMDVDNPAHVDVSCDCILADNKAKPQLHLRGSGDGVTNRVTQVSKIGFNINDSEFPSSGRYCIKPTALLNGYWIKENWGGCNVEVLSEGDFSITFNVTASQLGGSKVLATKEDVVFDWSSSDGYTGAIDQAYNASGSSSSESFTLYVDVDPADGDVYVEVSLELSAHMTGFGRYNIDLKNSNSFYFWVERIELSKCNAGGIHCVIGGPDNACLGGPIMHCLKIGGPDNACLKIGGPILQCFIGGPDNACTTGGPIVACSKIGGPGIIPVCPIGGPDKPGCIAGGPDDPGCHYGPYMRHCPSGPDVIIGCGGGAEYQVEIETGNIYEHGVSLTVDVDKIPNSMKRAFSKMIREIARNKG